MVLILPREWLVSSLAFRYLSVGVPRIGHQLFRGFRRPRPLSVLSRETDSGSSAFNLCMACLLSDPYQRALPPPTGECRELGWLPLPTYLLSPLTVLGFPTGFFLGWWVNLGC